MKTANDNNGDDDSRKSYEELRVHYIQELDRKTTEVLSLVEDAAL